MKRLILILILYSFNSGFSAITINSISKTTSTCLNNGTITVNATSNSQILYSIITGPSTVSPQSSNKFEGLAPGTYVVKVENLLAETATESVVIITNYVIIDFKQIVNHGSCQGANDGRVIGNALSGTGTKPLSWKLKNNNSGQVKTQIGNDTFNSLAPADYTLTVTDSCMNTTVHNFEVKTGVSGFEYLIPQIDKIECNKVEVISSFKSIDGAIPIKIKYQFGDSTIEKVPNFDGPNRILDKLGFSMPFGAKLKVTLYNSCNDSIIAEATLAQSYRICTELTTCNSVNISLYILYGRNLQFPVLNYKTKNGATTLNNLTLVNNYITFPVANIGEMDTINIRYVSSCKDTFYQLCYVPEFKSLIRRGYNTFNTKCNQRNYYYEFEDCDKTIGSISYSFYDINHKLLETKSGLGFDDITLRNYPSGTKYYIKIKNGCNKDYVDTFLWESEETKPFFEVNKKYAENCLDSTIGIEVSFNRSKGVPKIVSFTGPSIVKSSKYLYAYSDSTDFEKFYSSQTFIYYGLGVGKYSITFKDSCESSTVNFEVYPHEVSNYYYSYKPVKACEDNNQLILKLYSKHSTNLSDIEVNGFYSIYNLKTGKYLEEDESIAFKYDYNSSTNEISYNKTFRYLNEGKYLLKVKYRKDTFNDDIDFEDYVTKSVYCNEIQDTLIIPPYTRPNIKVILKIQCGTQTWVEFQPDTNFGIFPYKYEINKGPQLFPVQQDNVFPIYQMGNYQAKIWDTCGNANTMDFSVDTVKFNRIYINDSTCAGDSVIMAYQSSPYFTYKWLKPNGSIFIGDTLKIISLKVSDVGQYKITKYVNFRGCRDSFKIDYLLKKYKIEHKYDTIQDGDTFYIKSQPIIKEGSYKEVIPMLPCDSFFIQHLHVIDTYLNFVTKSEICIGDSFYYRGKYYRQPGVYIDTIDVFKYADSVFSLYLSIYPKVKLKMVRKTNVTCNGQHNGVINIIASGENPPYTFLLNGIYSNTGGYFSNLPPGNYKVTFVSNQNCIQDTVINITQPDKLILNVFAESDPIEVCKTSRLVSNVRYINGGALPPLDYVWSPSDGLSCTDCPSPKFNGYQSQKYTLTLKDTNNCKLVASTKVNVLADNNFFVPQIFTPNGDQLNDKYRVYCNCVKTIDFSIYNRWGVKVYHTKALDEGWNGQYNDVESPAGVYSYIARLTFMNGEIKEEVGEFILAR